MENSKINRYYYIGYTYYLLAEQLRQEFDLILTKLSKNEINSAQIENEIKEKFGKIPKQFEISTNYENLFESKKNILIDEKNNDMDVETDGLRKTLRLKRTIPIERSHSKRSHLKRSHLKRSHLKRSHLKVKGKKSQN